MNSIIKEVYPLFEMYQSLRSQLMTLVSDADLAYRPAENVPTLGALCQSMGEVEYSYIQSFKTFDQNFDYRHDDPTLQASVAGLAAWFQALDRELKDTLSALSEEEMQSRTIDRGGGFVISPRIQLEIYKEALLIFYGKVSVYLGAMGKELPEQWQAWIG